MVVHVTGSLAFHPIDRPVGGVGRLLSFTRFLIDGGHWNSWSSGTDWTGRGIGMVRLGRTGISHKARHGSELADKLAASFQEWGTCFSYIRNRGGHVAAGDLRCSESVGPGPSAITTAIRSNLLANRGLGRGFGMPEPLGDVIRPPCSHLTDCAIGNGESGVGTYIHQHGVMRLRRGDAQSTRPRLLHGIR